MSGFPVVFARSSPAPGANYFWVPGCWMWNNGAYGWRAGYWYAGQQNWVWIPDRYCYTPGGVIFEKEVEGVHLCCPKCVTAVTDALTPVAGVKGNTAVKGAKSFEVTGDLNDKEVFTALHMGGLAGKSE